MSAVMVGLLGIGLLLAVLFLLGMPVGIAMAMVGFAGFCYLVSFKAGLHMLGSVVWDTFSKYGLTVIPLFIFMGQVAFYSGVNGKLYNAAYRWIGHIRGGVAMATVMACSAFSAICGSNAATAATMTTVALPQMRKFNYHRQAQHRCHRVRLDPGCRHPSQRGADRDRTFNRAVDCPLVLRCCRCRCAADRAAPSVCGHDLPAASGLGAGGAPNFLA
jgi:hypothetical protein